MADVQHFNQFSLFEDAVYHAVDMRLRPIQQVPELALFTGHRAPAQHLLQAENSGFEAPVPFQSSTGLLRVDFVVKDSEVALGPRGEVNGVCHGRLQTLRRIAGPIESSLFLRLRGPDGFLRRRLRGRRYPANAGRPRRLARWLLPSHSQ